MKIDESKIKFKIETSLYNHGHVGKLIDFIVYYPINQYSNISITEIFTPNTSLEEFCKKLDEMKRSMIQKIESFEQVG